MRFCTNCGSKVEASVKFCVGCGKPLDSEPKQESLEAELELREATPAAGDKKKNLVLIIVAAVVLMAAAYVMFFDGIGRGIVGTWELIGIEGLTQEEFEEEMQWMGGLRIEFTRDNRGAWHESVGTMFEEKHVFTWEIIGNMLTVTEDGWPSPQQLEFSVSRNRLTLGEYGEAYIFRRR